MWRIKSRVIMMAHRKNSIDRADRVIELKSKR